MKLFDSGVTGDGSPNRSRSPLPFKNAAPAPASPADSTRPGGNIAYGADCDSYAAQAPLLAPPRHIPAPSLPDAAAQAPSHPAAQAPAERPKILDYVAQTAVGATAVAAGAGVYTLATSTFGASPLLGTCAALYGAWLALVKTKDAFFGLRSDGTQVHNATLLRRFMPYLMTTRESARIDYQQTLNLAPARAFVDKWNAEHADDPELKLTPFYVLLAAMQRANIIHPGLDRFVKGKRLFQRKEFSLAFVVKAEHRKYGALRTLKLSAVPGETFEGFIRRINQGVHKERSTKGANASEREIKLLDWMPRTLQTLGLQGRELLDSEGLWPKAMIDADPLYASVFVANLGSLDKDEMPNVKHHLYESGTISLFSTVCSVDESGPYPKQLINWTYDERVNDGHYCLAPLKAMRKIVEAPEQLLKPLDARAVTESLAQERADADHAFLRETNH